MQTQSLRIENVGKNTVGFLLRKAITYDGALQQIKRYLRDLSHPKNAFKEWKIEPAPGGSHATSMVVDPQHTQQSLLQDETSAETAETSDSLDTAEPAACFPFGLEFLLPRLSVAIEEVNNNMTTDFSQNYKWVGNDVLGKGAYGTVRAAMHKSTGTHIAIKTYNDTSHPQSCKEECLEELAFASKLGPSGGCGGNTQRHRSGHDACG